MQTSIMHENFDKHHKESPTKFVHHLWQEIRHSLSLPFFPTLAGVIKIVYGQPQWVLELLVSKEIVVLHWWESETIIWFYHPS